MTRPIAPGVRLVIRHGIFSNGANMGKLRQELMNRLNLAPPDVDNQTYDWQATILLNGVELAAALVAAPAADGVVLVGHSMGGLVCRIANCALTDPNFMNVVAHHAKGFRQADLQKIQAAVLAPVRVASIVTLATPNSGAMTHSQMAIVAHLIEPGLPYSLKSQGVSDLRTDRIFRILQHCRTPTPCLTMSGSWGNRFLRGLGSSAGHRLLQWAASMREPHDQVVEDASVDLAQSVLPHEFRRRPRHRRLYVDCTDVTHTTIHEKSVVQDAVAEFIRLHP